MARARLRNVVLIGWWLLGDVQAEVLFVPSVAPSDMPSAEPSVPPSTLHPTKTFQPTLTPSEFPSDAPSQTPSDFCHDHQYYRSPLNSFRCIDHIGTNCFQWRFLGLNVSEVERLILNCPISCSIPCGALNHLELNISYQISNVPNYLSPDADAMMEAASVEYLTNTIRALEPGKEFFLFGADLLSQFILNRRTVTQKSSRASNIRNSREEDTQTWVDLLVTVAFQGYALYLPVEPVEKHLVNGINSIGYTRAIQRSGSPELIDAETTTNIDNETTVEPPVEEPGRPGPSAGSVAAIVVVVLVVTATVVGVLWYKRHLFVQHLDAVQEEKEFGSDFRSPASSPRSQLSQVLSFETVLRMVSSRHTASASGSQTSAASEPSHSNNTEGESGSDETLTGESTEEEHPYTGIIPPMIVIDNIDCDELDGEEQSKHRVKNVVPVKRVEASPDFLQALKRNDRSFSDVFYEDPGYDTIPDPSNDHMMRETYIVMSSEDSDELSSTPMKQDQDDVLQMRLTVGNADAAETDMMSSLDTESPASRRSRVSRGSRASAASFESPLAENREANGPLVVGSDDHVWSFSEASTVIAGSEQFAMNSIDQTPVPIPAPPRDRGVHLSAMFQRASPARRIRSNPVPRYHDDTNVNYTSDYQAARRTSRHVRRSSRGSSSGSDFELSEGEVQHIFQIPRRGKLGLIIQCTKQVGPVVVHVKDYSPLLDQVHPGDRIVSIDGERTAALNLTEVTNLLTGRALTRWAATVRLVIVRTRMTDSPYDTMRHSSSYESGRR